MMLKNIFIINVETMINYLELYDEQKVQKSIYLKCKSFLTL